MQSGPKVAMKSIKHFWYLHKGCHFTDHQPPFLIVVRFIHINIFLDVMIKFLERETRNFALADWDSPKHRWDSETLEWQGVAKIKKIKHLYQFFHKIHLVEEKTDDYKASIVTEFFHHQIRPEEIHTTTINSCKFKIVIHICRNKFFEFAIQDKYFLKRCRKCMCTSACLTPILRVYNI